MHANDTAKSSELPPAIFWSCEAAEGWLLLSNPGEALGELDQIPLKWARHPAVLAVEWRTATAAGDHQRAWIAARQLCEIQPRFCGAWICQANSLRELRGAQAAADLLLCVVDRFAGEPVLQYNLACFCAQVGDWSRCCFWLLEALESEAGDKLKELALIDPDLKPLWEKLGESSKLVACLHPLKT